MHTNNSKLILAMSETYREIFDDVTNEHSATLIPPTHFDMVIQSVLVGFIKFYFSQLNLGSMFDNATSQFIRSHIYESNVKKIKDELSEPFLLILKNPFGWRHDDKLSNLITDDYTSLVNDSNKAKYIIQQVIDDTNEELLKYYQNHHLKNYPRPKQFFINCFIHPLPSLAYNNALYDVAPESMDENFENIYIDLIEETRTFTNRILKEFKK